MSDPGMRRYLFLALEFAAYSVMMALLVYLMILILLYRPQAGGAVFVLVGVGTALFTGIYAARMFGFYRTAARLVAASKQTERPRHWSDRIAAAEAIRAQELLRRHFSQTEASPALQAIRLRIAERMAREDRERAERERAEREKLDRERIERARTARIKGSVKRIGHSGRH
ncbi:hypothetical protein ACX40Y_15540 [Sphingomonas sp. RS6]